ncbi:MAG: hypothetical protein Q4D31_07830, partial [Eubacteriales bacterium]|nr:hypothetical protein [Eubacteriales bacterium]
AANWLTGISLSQMPPEGALRRLHERLSGGATGYELRASGVAAAQPVQLALTVDGQLTGVQYSLSDIAEGMAAVQPLWAQALTGDALEQSTEQALAAALTEPCCALLRYHGAIPLSAVAGWTGSSRKADGALAAETLVYAAQSGQLFVRAADGTLYSAPTRVEEAVLAAAQQDFRGQRCRFAGADGTVCPETLLFERETLTLPLLATSGIDLFGQQSSTGLEDVLAAFSFTAYSAFYAEQNDAVRVFVDNVSTLRVSAGGLLQFAATGADSAVRAYDEGEVSGAAALDAQLDRARLILDKVMQAADTGTHASLYAVQQAEGRTTLVFVQMYGGVPVLGEHDLATFTFQDGALLSATIRLQRFTAEGLSRTVLPAVQAAASGGGRSLMVVYRPQQDGTLAPMRVFLRQAQAA